MIDAALEFPAGSLTALAARVGRMVPSDEIIALTSKLMWSPESVTVQATPVAVPAFEISYTVKVDALIASEKVIVKFAGKLFLVAA